MRVAVASNFLPTAEALAERFQHHTAHTVKFSSASTGKLYAQIVNGAPYDVFLAADRERPERLEREGRAQPGTRFTYALGRLVLWSVDPRRVDPEGKVLAEARVDRLAIANPELAPYGRAAQETLQDLGVWEALEPRLVRGENIAQAFLFASSGGTGMGLVSRAQVLHVAGSKEGSYWVVPGRHHSPIEQQAVRLSSADGAAEWLSFLASDEGRAVIAEHGYDLP
ncbi:MAG: molybdate ABC transporter substrate-binding protein [Gammaproteobacteria bacterium]